MGRRKGNAGKARPETGRAPGRLPALLRPLFWDYSFDALTWERDRDLVISRVLTSGGWDAVTWLRQRLGSDALRQWLEARRGDGLNRRQLRFWELILGLPHREVNAWLADPRRRIWDQRTNP